MGDKPKSQKRKSNEIARDRRNIAQLYLQGVFQADIGKQLGISQPTVSRDLTVIQNQWAVERVDDFTERKNTELAKVDNLELEHWIAWKRSQEDAETKKAVKGGTTGNRGEITIKGQVGDPRYLTGIQWCINKRCELLGLDAPKNYDGANLGDASQVDANLAIPAEMVAPDFSNVVRAVKSGEYREYLLKGGRGSTKSTFVSLEIIEHLVNNPTWHALVLRDKSNTLRRTVYKQIAWAISELGLSDKFKKTKNPLEMTYLPTGQMIYFAGAKDPDNIKGIKLEFGYLALGWFEELDQFAGAEAVRKIEQSFMRGGNEFHVFKTYNPPKSANNWANKYCLIPKDGQYIHDSDYRSVPVEWLGQPFIDEAEHLKKINPKAYQHEYLGEVVGIGGQVLENVEIREITNEEIEQFDHILHGLDFGWFPDPTHYMQMYYHAPSLTLYIFGELRKWKTRNRAMYKKIVDYGYNEEDLIIGDNTPPQNIADYRAYGANIRGAEKGAGSRKYRRRWMQSLVAIVVDPVRCPYTAEELPSLEYTQTKDGEFISEIPDENDHAFDAAGYGTNLIWRKQGK